MSVFFIYDVKLLFLTGQEIIFRLLRRIKQEHPDSQVIVITGHGDRDLAGEAARLGAVDFISKPIRKSDLDEALRKAEQGLRGVPKRMD